MPSSASSATAVEGARSASTLGRAREGSGVVITSDGLVLTIGYLVLEAESVEIRPDDGRRIPARVVAYDLATGFGLVQALAPLRIEPVPFGTSSAATRDEPLMVASGGDDGTVSIARLLSRRVVLRLLGVPHRRCALHRAAAARPQRRRPLQRAWRADGHRLALRHRCRRPAEGGRSPGNMFVPVDLLKPILAELRERGASRASTRAWMGLNCVERGGEVRVMRVSDDSPADVAGLQPGDRIVRIDGSAVAGLAQLYQALWAGGTPERAVTLEILREGTPAEHRRADGGPGQDAAPRRRRLTSRRNSGYPRSSPSRTVG